MSLRSSNDFESIEAYQDFINEAIQLRNISRAEKLAEEKEFMKPLDGSRLPDYEEEVCRCNKYGLVRIGKGSYSIPQKYRHQTLRVRIYETRVSLYHEKNCIASFETHPNESGARIDYRHLIVDLCRKPGAFTRYRYQVEFFPGEIWRKSYEQLHQNYSESRANKEYLQILKLTLEEGKEAIEALLTNLLKENKINLDQVRHQLGKQETSCYNQVEFNAELKSYDSLLSNELEVKHG